MAHTIEDLIIEIADKYSNTDSGYLNLKQILEEFVKRISHPTYKYKLYSEDKKELGWISVKERSPKESGWYFTCIDDNSVPQAIGCSYYDFKSNRWYDAEDQPANIDYWMNIPKL